MTDMSIKTADTLSLSAAIERKDGTCALSANSKRTLWGFGGVISAAISLTTAATIERLWGQHLVDCAPMEKSPYLGVWCLFQEVDVAFKVSLTLVSLGSALFCASKAMGEDLDASSAGKSNGASIALAGLITTASVEAKTEKPTDVAKKEDEAKAQVKATASGNRGKRGRSSSRLQNGHAKKNQ